MATARAEGALSHIRVLDLSRVLAGPWASQILGDLGAEVLKIERPGAGDDTRGWGPPYAEAADGSAREAAYFLTTNRNKSSVAIDMGTAEGAALIRRLAAESDVVIENFKVGGLKKYGLDQETLRALNPRLIYCSITGFGQTGPYAPRAGYDFMIQAMGGLMSVTGEPDEVPGGGPVKVGVALVDVMTGLYATIGVLAALAHRERTGAGQYIDLALLDVSVATLANQAMNYLVSGKAPGRMGNAHPNIVPYQAFATQDGHLVLAIGNDEQFRRFAAEAGHPDWGTDPRFATNAQRVANRAALVPLVAGAVATRTTDDWIAALESKAVPCGPINTLDRVFADPQVQARGLARQIAHPALGSVPTVANPLNLSATPVDYARAAPRLGADTDETLGRLLGLDAAALADLRKRGVIG
ncbi:MAG: CoA transferase [Tistrella sp.]|jgi:crotonobetainyl-CoA:carnitine CoA-transferase CaiB-like acyl-CoA transferase|uniref:CoA transferase n=1 Tax=Tistrella mobilis TaxID=171437 RepID=A0A3B9IJ63_9PROT|nr:CaiB/BaiF CoA-transferase family protein [Tistrella sp.]MAD37265.1 CoA transferase [Tistrella sp.]MBA77920.1 CoA transferase [Tistrella sp.]HAE47363.1 CoA transferase [Tistrella mobilis]